MFRLFVENKDSYGTLENFHKKFGINHIPSQKEFNKLLNAPVVFLKPEQAAQIENTSLTKDMIGKGIDYLKGKAPEGTSDQRHDSYQSILHHINNKDTKPVIIVKYGGRMILLDGDHRLIGLSLMNRKIPAKIIDLGKYNV